MSGGGGKSKSTSTSYSGSSNPAFQPYAIQGVNTVNQIVGKAQPGLEALTSQLTGGIIPQGQANYTADSALAGQGRGYFSDVLSGKYMSGNPYLQGMIDQSGEDISNRVNSIFARSGRYGSDAHGGALTRELANSQNALRYQNYSDEMGRMGQAAGAGGQMTTASLAGLLQALGQGAEMPYTGASTLANALGALFAGGQEKSQSTQKGPSPIWGAIGSGLGAAAALASDPRLKTNIVRIGEWDDRGDGLGKYEWNWKGDPDGPKVTGVLSTEVAVLRPQAYHPNFDGRGYDGVNYAALSA